jgi:hypothetical protein
MFTPLTPDWLDVELTIAECRLVLTLEMVPKAAPSGPMDPTGAFAWFDFVVDELVLANKLEFLKTLAPRSLELRTALLGYRPLDALSSRFVRSVVGVDNPKVQNTWLRYLLRNPGTLEANVPNVATEILPHLRRSEDSYVRGLAIVASWNEVGRVLWSSVCDTLESEDPDCCGILLDEIELLLQLGGKPDARTISTVQHLSQSSDPGLASDAAWALEWLLADLGSNDDL